MSRAATGPLRAEAPASSLAPRFGVYVHIPFCVSVCPYCDFNVYAGMESSASEYLDAVLAEARARAAREPQPEPAGSVFFGGGTPSLVDPATLARFLDALRGVIEVRDDAEVSIEANPETVSSAHLRILRDAGFTRVSLGVQSFVPHVLATLGRAHSPDVARRAFASARDAGFDDVNVDLIFGAQGESREDWVSSLDEATALEPDHVSCYGLTIEQGTAFGAAVARGSMAAPDEDDLAWKYELACDAIGLPHYEISNWGRPSRHNLVYWTQGEYVGLGAGAHSHRAGVRSWNRKHPRSYAAHSADPREGEERLDAHARAKEWLQLRLRLVEGLDLAEASERVGGDLVPAACGLEADGLGVIESGWLRLTRRGLLLENEVAIRLGAA